MNKSNKISLLIIGPLTSGGIATFNLNLIKGLQCEANIDIYIYTFFKSAGHKLKNELLKKGIKNLNYVDFKYILLHQKNFKEIIIVSALYYSVLAYFLPIENKQLIHVLHGYRPVVGTNSNSKGWISLLISLFTACGSYLANYLGSRLAKTVISNSELTRSFYRRFFHVDSVVIPLFFNVFCDDKKNRLSTLPSKDKRKYDLIFVGRLVRHKNLDVVIESVKLFESLYGFGLKFCILGDGTEKESLTNLIDSSNNLKSNFDFVGWISHDAIDKYFDSSKVFISLCELEPFGFVFCEALSRGLPVIAHQYTGVAEYLNQYCYPVPLDTYSIAETMYKVLMEGVDYNHVRESYVHTSSKRDFVKTFIRKIINP